MLEDVGRDDEFGYFWKSRQSRKALNTFEEWLVGDVDHKASVDYEIREELPLVSAEVDCAPQVPVEPCTRENVGCESHPILDRWRPWNKRIVDAVAIPRFP